MRVLYSALFYLLLPFIVVRLLWRSRKAPAYRRRLGERLGFFCAPSNNDKPVIWLHAVSVGETIAAKELVAFLLAQYDQHKLVVTTTTPTGSEQVKKLFGDKVFHVYAPWDIPCAMARFMDRIKPKALIIMETELWPNMLHQASKRGVPVLLANARMSKRSAKGYAKVSALTGPMLTSLHTIACQSKSDATRFIALGATPETVQVTGSVKFDVSLDEVLKQKARVLRDSWQADSRAIIVAASTHPGEDQQILAAFAAVKQHHKNALLVLVPRHPERFDEVAKQCEAADWQTLRRSVGEAPTADTDIVLGDTMGELFLLLATARVAIIGGSLVPHGGHNILEAAAWGVPVITGPWMFNFSTISDLMVDAGAMLKLDDVADLSSALLAVVDDSAKVQVMGEAGLAVVAANRGAQLALQELVAALFSD